MYEFLLIATFVAGIAGTLFAWDSTRDPFHPLVLMCPMFTFIYGWMPWKLYHSGNLTNFFDNGQLIFVQTLFLCGMVAFIVGCLSAGKVRFERAPAPELSFAAIERLVVGGVIVGGIGLACWLTSVINVGGISEAFSHSYAGGWDDSGYIRDGSLLLLSGILLLMAAVAQRPSRLGFWAMTLLFVIPWVTQAVLTARRGPSFAIVAVLSTGWFLHRKARPPVLMTALIGITLGYLVLFLVTNRSQIYLGSNFEMKTNVNDIVEKPDTGNEYIYGSGSVLSAERRNKYFWGKRYAAQVLVRPIPKAVWPTKYEDFGVPELLHNAGTGEGFAEELGWTGAVGSAPGIVADLWVEGWWLAVPFMGLLGWLYGSVWKKAVVQGGGWATQYSILAALSIYLVMQTMEAVIFRSLILSIPIWFVWRGVDRAEQRSREPLHQPNLMLVTYSR